MSNRFELRIAPASKASTSLRRSLTRLLGAVSEVPAPPQLRRHRLAEAGFINHPLGVRPHDGDDKEDEPSERLVMERIAALREQAVWWTVKTKRKT